MTRKVLVLGAGGFIGSHLVKRLKREGCWVRGVDLKEPEWSKTEADEFVCHDLRELDICERVIRFRGEQGNFYNDVPKQYEEPFDEIYQLAADMGGAGYVFTGENDAKIMHNSVMINLNILDCVCRLNEEKDVNKTRIFYSSSACIYPEYNQQDPNNPKTKESSVYPAQPDSEYGWEKLFSERLYLAYRHNYKLDVCIARYHNIFGPEGSWNDGREKVIAALCRKIAKAIDEDAIEIWGDGLQTRSFLYIDECLEGTLRLMRSEHTGPFNIGSSYMITINELANIIIKIARKKLVLYHIKGPLGVRGRTSDNNLIYDTLGWKPVLSIITGLRKTYSWILEQVKKLEV